LMSGYFCNDAPCVCKIGQAVLNEEINSNQKLSNN
jgi:hypothetical protein